MSDTTDTDTPSALATLEPAERIAVLDTGPTIEQIRSLVEKYPEIRLTSITDPVSGVEVPALLGPQGIAPVPASIFSEYLTGPRQRSGTSNFTKIESLIDHVNRFKDASSALFAVDDRASPSITAVLDYHHAGAASLARFGKHRSIFAFPLSDEWKAWTKMDGEPMEMGDFAAFLEDRIIDVLHLVEGEDSLPEDLRQFINLCGGTVATPNKLVELSRGLHVHENSAVTQAINLSTGEAQISFQTEHTDANGVPLKVPGLFLIGIPVFKGGPIYRIAARLRYRKQAGLKFFYELWRTDRTFDHAFNEACERVRIETGLPLLFGKPE
ncbi:MAG: DUF2303 family protein [Sphingobium sp.]